MDPDRVFMNEWRQKNPKPGEEIRLQHSHIPSSRTRKAHTNSCLADKRPPPEVNGQSAGSIDSSIEH